MNNTQRLTTRIIGFLFISISITAPLTINANQLTELQQQAMDSELAWQLVESLTTEVGARMPATDKDAEGVQWMGDKFTELGFDKVWTEAVTFPRWVRGTETARMIAPFTQPLAIIGLGGSPATSGEITAEVVEFKTYKDLEAAADDSLKGKIAYISNRMERHKNGAGYGPAVTARSRGPYVAMQKGAQALLIRSIGTDTERLPHTGGMSNSQHKEPEKGMPVPAAALSNPDADLLSHAIARGKPVSLALEISSGYRGEYTSYNVIGEITGSTAADERVVVGGHLDSWDPGTGAIDDAAGIGIMTAAAKLVSAGQRPLRSIWVVAFANEEQGLYGAKAFAAAHADEMDRFILGGESDFGAGRVYRIRVNISNEALPAIHKLAKELKPLGIELDLENKAGGGADVGRLRAAGVAVIDLSQDGTRYFDWHHTANDTLDKIVPEELAQNVAAWATVINAAANSDTQFGPIIGDEQNQIGNIVLENNPGGKQ